MTAKEKRRLAALERRVAELEKATAIFKDAESVMVLTKPIKTESPTSIDPPKVVWSDMEPR